MKKIAITGMMILLVSFLVTCDEGFPKDNEKEVEYTDVVYSEDGSTITLYLDGVGVPKTQAQRAITRDLAKMAYDYFEVIFITRAGTHGATSDVVARAQWELGQSAGISGVYRGDATYKGADFSWDSEKDNEVALIFVGMKNDKTLLGVGQLAEVDHSASGLGDPPGWTEATSEYGSIYTTFATGFDANGLPLTPYAYIRPSTTSVTFYVEAIKTGLLIGGETEGDGNNAIDAKTDSFTYTGANSSPTATDDWSSRVGHSKRQAPSSKSNALYPIYALPEEKNAVQHAEYEFKGGAATFAGEIRYNADPVIAGPLPGKGIAIERRFPRYLEGGRYMQLKENTDTDTTVVLDTGKAPYNAVLAKDTALNPIIPLVFTTKGSGVFSFFIEIPVYMITKDLGTNSGELQPIIWKLRTGLGSELYSLDSGKSSGGCVLMGIGDIDLDWLEIYWEWVD